VFVLGIFVVKQDSTLSFFDEGAVDVVHVGLNYLFYFGLPIGVVYFGEWHPFLGASCFVKVAGFSHYPKVVLLIYFAAKPFVKLSSCVCA
jgi:hypothetical protein